MKIDKEIVGWDIHESLEDRYKSAAAKLLERKRFNLHRLEQQATRAKVDPSKQAKQELIGVNIEPNFEQKLVAEEMRLGWLAGPLIGATVLVLVNYHCRKVGDRYVETTEEYSPVRIEGVVTGLHSVITEFQTPYHRGFEPQGVNLPADGTFEHYRVCLGIGQTLVPLEPIDGSWNKLTVISQPEV